jgi:hypothetical protein
MKQGGPSVPGKETGATPIGPANEYARKLLQETGPTGAAAPQQAPTAAPLDKRSEGGAYSPAYVNVTKLIEKNTSADLNLATLPGSVIDQAREVALTRGPNAVAQFMSDKGFPKSGPWCGEFAAAVVRSVGGTPPKNPEVASNWRTYGLPIAAPQEGSIAIRKGSLRGYGVRTGETGSHVTFVDSVDRASGTFMGVGGNQPSNKERFRISDYDFRSQ